LVIVGGGERAGGGGGGGERHWGQGSGHAGPMLRLHRYEKTPGQQKAIRAQKLQYSLTE